MLSAESAREVGDLENHKSVIENGVTSLTASADENAKSAEVTTDNMGRLRGVVKECDGVKRTSSAYRTS